MSSIIAGDCYSVPVGTDSVPFGDWLKQEIDRRGWTVSDLAARMGVRPATVSRWTIGIRNPDPASCNAIAAALDVDPDLVLAHAGHRPSRVPISIYEAERLLRESKQRSAEAEAQAVAAQRMLEEYAHGQRVAVPFYGRMPADSVRWVASEERGETEPVPEVYLGGRSPREVFLVVASGDCLAARPYGIVDGDYVLCERLAPGTEPRNGDVVVVEVQGGERTLKVWQRHGDWIELQDGEGKAIHRMSILSEFRVEGRYFLRWGGPGTR